jgi:hypothetical protein
MYCYSTVLLSAAAARSVQAAYYSRILCCCNKVPLLSARLHNSALSALIVELHAVSCVSVVAALSVLPLAASLTPAAQPVQHACLRL